MQVTLFVKMSKGQTWVWEGDAICKVPVMQARWPEFDPKTRVEKLGVVPL